VLEYPGAVQFLSLGVAKKTVPCTLDYLRRFLLRDQEMSLVIGIDFGTTKTVAAVMKNGYPIVIPDRHGHLSIPSLVLVTPEEEIFIGWEAQNHI
jgi:molecular chaperone DnaK (HSP70)